MRRFALSLVFGSMLSGFAAVGYSQTQPQAKVTFTCRAARIDHILDQLSKVANVPLEATTTMQSEILVISVQNVSLNDLLARIATVTSGEWKEMEGGGYRLVQSSSLRNAEERQSLEARVAAIRKSIQDHLTPPTKGTEKPGDPGKNTVTVAVAGDSQGSVQSQGPAADRLYRIINRTDIGAIARLGSGERLVFSTQPTRMQRAFAGNIVEDVNQLVKEHNADVAKMSGQEDAQLAQMPDFIKKMAERMTKPIGTVSKALLVVSRMSFGSFGMLSTELRFYGPDGKVAYSMPGALDIPGSGLGALVEEAGGLLPGAKPAPAATKSTPVEMSPDTEAILKAFQSVSTQPNKGIALTPDIKAKLFHPDKFDPLSFLATDQVLSLAKKRGLPVVAELPDDAVSILSMVMPNKKPTVEEFELNLNRKASVQIVPDPKWLTIKPANPAESRLTRLDRDALAALLKVTEEKGIPTLDDIAAYSLKAPSPLGGGLGQLYVLYFVPGVMSQGMMGITSWETMRFYGSLEPSSRNLLFSGGQIPFSSLTTYQTAQVTQMIYGAMPSLEVDNPNQDPNDAMPSIMRAFAGASGNYMEEPTELLPNGLPGNGYVSLKVSKEPFASPVMPDGGGVPGTMAVMDAEMLATFKMLKETPAYASFSSMIPSPEQVRIGEKTSLAFTFQVAQKVAAHQTLNDNRLAPGTPTTSMQNLPADFQKLIAEKLEAAKKSPLGALAGLMGTMGGTIKP